MEFRGAGLIMTLILSLLAAAPLTTNAQQPIQEHRIGVLHGGSPPPQHLEALQQGLRDLGYVEGQNLIIERRYAEGSVERLPTLAAELLRLQVEVLVAVGNAATRTAQQATRTIPIVMLTASDAVEQGFAASLAHPGSNITGLLGPVLSGKRLESLKEAVPHLSRVAVLVNPANRASEPEMANLTVTARALSLYLHVLELRRADELDHAFMAMTRESVEALLVQPDALLIDRLPGRIVDLAAQHRLPAMYPWKMYVEAGGLMSYSLSMLALWRRGAYYVDRILKGTTPAMLPVEQPTQFEFVINLKTAAALGLTIPPHLLVLADEIFR